MGCFISCFHQNIEEPQEYYVKHFDYNLIYDSNFESEIINDNCNYLLPLNYNNLDTRHLNCD